jgi:signal transduction histidine kinase
VPQATDFDVTGVTSYAGDKQLDFGLLANFIHQVINPLSGTSGHIGNLIEGTIPESKRDQRMRAARAQLEHAISLMRNLAYFSQISQDPFSPNPGSIRKVCVIPQTIIEALQFYQEMASNKKVTIEHLNRWDQYKVVGNPDLLR